MTFGTISNPKKGDIVFAPMPYSNLRGYKQRPALVLAQFGEDVLLCLLTSNLTPRQHSLPITNGDLVKGRLAGPSLVKISSLAKIDANLIKTSFAHLKPELFNRVRDEFRALV